MSTIPCRRSVPLILVTLAACGGERPLDGSTAFNDSAGVQLATAPAVDQPLAWTLTELFRLGGADEGPGSFTAASAFNTGTDRAGNIYVLDAQQFRVEVFSPSGDHLRFLGRKGGGPGEIEFPIMLSLDPSGIVHVFDITKRALVRWDAAGELLPELSLQGTSFGTIKVFGDTLVLDQQVRTLEERSSRLLRVIGADTLELTSLSGPGGQMVQFSCVAFVAPPLFSSALSWTANSRWTAATRQSPYQVDLYEGAELVRSIRRPIPSKAASVEDVARLHPDGMTVRFGGGGACTISASEIMEKQGVADVLPQVRALTLDPQGRLWVERYTFSDEPDLVDLFSAEGSYLGTMTGKGPPLGFIGDDLVLFAEENADTGVSQVVAYRISDGD